MFGTLVTVLTGFHCMQLEVQLAILNQALYICSTCTDYLILFQAIFLAICTSCLSNLGGAGKLKDTSQRSLQLNSIGQGGCYYLVGMRSYFDLISIPRQRHRPIQLSSFHPPSPAPAK